MLGGDCSPKRDSTTVAYNRNPVRPGGGRLQPRLAEDFVQTAAGETRGFERLAVRDLPERLVERLHGDRTVVADLAQDPQEVAVRDHPRLAGKTALVVELVEHVHARRSVVD